MPEEIKPYISLMDATRFCNYSQEYLSLRARRGKLKAVKDGRNWVTTKEWLNEYIEKTEQYKEKLVRKNSEKEIFFKIKTVPFSLENNVAVKSSPVSEVQNLEKGGKIIFSSPDLNLLEKKAVPPDNLPIENISFSKIKNHDMIFSVLKIGFSFGLAFGILVGALALNRVYFGNFLDSAYGLFDGPSSPMAYAGKTFSDYFSWLGGSYIYVESSSKISGLANGLKAIINFNF